MQLICSVSSNEMDKKILELLSFHSIDGMAIEFVAVAAEFQEKRWKPSN